MFPNMMIFGYIFAPFPGVVVVKQRNPFVISLYLYRRGIHSWGHCTQQRSESSILQTEGTLKKNKIEFVTLLYASHNRDKPKNIFKKFKEVILIEIVGRIFIHILTLSYVLSL